MSMHLFAYAMLAAGATAVAPTAPAPQPGQAPRQVEVTATVSRVLSDDAAQVELAALHSRLERNRLRLTELSAQLDRAANGDPKREALQKSLEALRVTVLDDERRRELLERALGSARENLRSFAYAARPLRDTRVNLDIQNASTGEALKQLFDKAKEEYTVEGELPEDKRITLRADNVRLDTALDLVAQSAGIGWARTPEGKFKVGKGIAGNTFMFLRQGGQNLVLPGLPAPQPFQGKLHPAPPLSVQVSPLAVIEERSSFSCPHCKGQVTVLRRRQQPKCTKCERLFQPGWQFCPEDGAKRPETGRDWKHCPFCGKEVKFEKSLAEPAPGSVFLLGAVSAPGQFPLEEGLRLRMALERAGGVTRAGNTRRVLILHRDSSVTRIDLSEEGALPRDPVLEDGDAVLVPPVVEMSREESSEAFSDPCC